MAYEVPHLKPHQFKKGEGGRPAGTRNKKTLQRLAAIEAEIDKKDLMIKLVRLINDRVDEDSIKSIDALTAFSKFATYVLPNMEKAGVEETISTIETPEEAQQAVELLLERVKQITEKE